MHNPYATSPAGQAATGTRPFATPEDARVRDYDDAIGPNSEYYRPRFEAYDARGAGLSWHWPAFFATSAWFVYRRLYLVGVLNFFWPWILMFVAGLLIGMTVLSPVVGGTAILLLGPVPWIALTLTANRIYWRRVKRLIEDTPAYDDPVRRSRELERVGGVARGPMAAMVVFTVLYGVGIIGVLAAIAIPAYQDYTIRAQVSEGLNLATRFKLAVAEYRERNGEWPANVAALGEREANGKYTESVAVDQGSVVITYGGQANRKLLGLRLVLLPGIDENSEVHWACGDAALPEGVQAGSGPHGSELPSKYMPAICRSQ